MSEFAVVPISSSEQVIRYSGTALHSARLAHTATKIAPATLASNTRYAPFPAPSKERTAVALGDRRTRRVARNASYIGLGAYAIGRKLIDSRTTAQYNRMIRAAELSGQHQAALEWDQQKLELPERAASSTPAPRWKRSPRRKSLTRGTASRPYGPFCFQQHKSP